MAERLQMSIKDIRRAKVMEMVKEKRLTLLRASELLELSYRQSKRVYGRYLSCGDAGIIHRSVGHRSNRQMDPEFRAHVVGLYRDHYADFGPTFASEKMLQRDSVSVNRETLRLWLIAEGLWQSKRRRHTYRQRRERRERFGELLQFDGSHHDWFEGRASKCCLMNMVDDATGTTYSQLFEQETTEAALRLLWAWIERYGIPQAVYCDRKNAFVLNREATIEEQLQGVKPLSPFELACEKLGIEVITAHSPQAKGRVERNHGVYQDRFIKELRLEGITDIETANEFLADTYLPAINTKFAKLAMYPEDAHAPLFDRSVLCNVFCFEEGRKVSNDYVVLFNTEQYQLVKEERRALPKPGDRVTVRRWLDGSVHIFLKDRELVVKKIAKTKEKEENAEALSA